MIKRRDIILGAVLILLGLAVYGILFFGRKTGSRVVVYEAQDKIADYSLTEDGTYILKTKNGENVLVIKDGEASITEADCPDGVCIRMGSISKTGENIVCLPHRLVVQIEELNHR